MPRTVIRDIGHPASTRGYALTGRYRQLMEAIAWRDAEGGEPIDNDTAESLDRFYVAKDDEAPRALVTGTGPWRVSGRDPGGTYGLALGGIDRHGEYYLPTGAGGTRHTSTPSLLYAAHALL